MKNDVLVYTPTGPASYDLTAIVHEYSSLIWHEKCKEPGEVQLNAPKTETNLRALVENNVLMLENHTFDKAHQSGLVRGAIITEVTDSEDEEELVVSGRMLDWLLTWRTVPDSPKTGTGTYGAALYDLLAAGATFDGARWLKSRDVYAAMGSDAGNPAYEQGELYETAQSLIGVEKNLYFEVGFTPDPEPAPEPERVWKTTGKVQSATVEGVSGTSVGRTVIYGASQSVESSILPSGYTQLEYIESTGTQWIDTGFVPNQDSRVTTKVDLSKNTLTTASIFGGRTLVGQDSFALWLVNGAFRTDYGSNNLTTGKKPSGVMEIDKNGKTTVISGSTYTNTQQTFTASNSLALFACKGIADGVVDERIASFSMYYAKVYDGENLVRDFIPCKNQSGTVGMYDLVGAKFYENNGTEAFVAGPEVPPSVVETPMQSVALVLNGVLWQIDLGGKTLGEGQVLTIERDGSATIDGEGAPRQTMPTMPSGTVEITTASSLLHYFDLEYLQQGEKPGPVERPPLVLNIFQGRDLSSRVEFSTELANLKGFEITSGIADYRNVAKIVGEQTVWYPETGQPTGLDRREIYVDGSSVKSEDYYPLAPPGGLFDEETGELLVPEGEVIPPEYQTPAQKSEIKAQVKKALLQLGAEAVADHPKTESVNFEILDFGQYEYMVDWDLGDVVRVSDENRGLSFNIAITEVQEVFDKDGYRVVPTFGTPAVSLQKVIRRLRK